MRLRISRRFAPNDRVSATLFFSAEVVIAILWPKRGESVLIGYVSDERHPALSDVALLFENDKTSTAGSQGAPARRFAVRKRSSGATQS